MSLGLYLEYLDDLDGALAEYESALSTNNQKYFAEIHYNKAMCYHILQNWDEAVKEFNSSSTFLSSFSGSPNELRRKHHDLLYFWADALVRKAKNAVLKIQDYLDKFENYDPQKSKKMESYLNNFNKKLNDIIDY